MSNSNHKSQPEVPFVDLAAQFRSLEPEINAAIAGVLQRTDFILENTLSCSNKSSHSSAEPRMPSVSIPECQLSNWRSAHSI